MLRVIAVNTGTKYSQWWTDNLIHMVDTYSGLDYDEFVVLSDDRYELQVANKLVMFDRFRDGQNIFFDLDVIIKGDCNRFLSDALKVCWAWWRPAYHTPLNSSIISWTGDRSDVFETWDADPEYYMLKYNRGIDQYLHEVIRPNLGFHWYGFCSYQTETRDLPEYPVVLMNQRQEEMISSETFSEYLLPRSFPLL